MRGERAGRGVSHRDPFVYVNEKKITLDRVDPYMSLGMFLIEQGLMGARVIDDAGNSGADAVTLVRYDAEKKRFTYRAVPAFLIPLVAVAGQQIMTVEGIGTLEAMNPIQQRFYNCESFQCGYCAGGYIMSIYSLLRENQKPTCADIEDALDGHFCRCTGYRPISAAAFGYASDAPKAIFYGDPNWKFEESHKFDIEKEPVAPKQIADDYKCNFKFKRFVEDPAAGSMMRGIEVPGTLDDLRIILEDIPNTIIITPGNENAMTADCLEADKSKLHYTLTHRVQELEYVTKTSIKPKKIYQIEKYDCKLTVGINTTIQYMIDYLKQLNNKAIKLVIDALEHIPKEHRNYKSFNSLLDEPIYNTLLSTLSPVPEKKGDILSPINYFVPKDTNIAFGLRYVLESLAHGYMISKVNKVSKMISCKICLIVKGPNVEVKQEAFEMKYVDSDNKSIAFETILNTLCGMVKDKELLKYVAYLKHSIVMALGEAEKLSEFEIACPVEYKKLVTWEKENHGPPVTLRSFPRVEDTVEPERKEGEDYWDLAEGKIPPANHKLHTKYVYKEILQQNGAAKVTGTIRFPSDKYALYKDVLHAFPVLTTVTCGTIIDIDTSEAEKVPGFFAFYSAKDLPEDSPNSFSGIPPNDTPVFVNKNGRVLHCDQIIGIVTATTRKVAIYCSKLIKVKYDTDMESERNKDYKKRAEIERKRLDSAGDNNTSTERCYTIKEAMELNNYHPHCGVGERVVTLGLNSIKSPENVNNKDLVRDKAFDEHEPDRDTDAPMDPDVSKKMITEIIDKCEVVVEGEITIGGQEHFYSEPFTATVVPTTHDNYLVHVSSQNVSKIQADISRNMKVPSSKIIARAEHIGGGFGGKQDRPQIVAVPAAVASILSKRPVTITLTRDVDMRITGGRHGYVCQYRIGLDKSGKIHALDSLVVADGGGTYDVTAAVLDKSIFQHTSVYTIPKIRVEGRAARTNHPTNTAYRGFGAPQTTQLLESIFDHAAQVIHMDPTEFRTINLNKPGDKLITGTYTGSTKACDIPMRLLHNVEKMSDYFNKKKEIEEFNKQPENKFIKRGIAIVPLKNSVCFEEDFMNQSHALVHVYADGTVRVAHSGIEMGQGLNTKMRMVAAETLRVNIDRVYVGPTGTDTCANTQPTAASSGTDSNAPAVRNACEAIRKRLEKVRDSLGSKDESLKEDGTPDPNAPIESFWGEAGFNGAVISAYFGRVNLSEHVYFHLPHLQWNWPAKIGYTGFYTAYGICCSEVELNAITGEYRLIRCDVIEDVGNTLNPALDCGQVEGGFTQGLGWITTEELCYDNEDYSGSGILMNSSLDEYIMPTMRTVPNEVHTSLLDGTGDPESAYGAKASAEAPVCLSSGVHFALRDAVRSYWKGLGEERLILIPTPTTPLTMRKFLE